MSKAIAHYEIEGDLILVDGDWYALATTTFEDGSVEHSLSLEYPGKEDEQ